MNTAAGETSDPVAEEGTCAHAFCVGDEIARLARGLDVVNGDAGWERTAGYFGGADLVNVGFGVGLTGVEDCGSYGRREDEECRLEMHFVLIACATRLGLYIRCCNRYTTRQSINMEEVQSAEDGTCSGLYA